MKKTIKKEGDEERPTLAVIINGVPDLSLMPPEELDLLAQCLDRIIDELARREGAEGSGGD